MSRVNLREGASVAKLVLIFIGKIFKFFQLRFILYKITFAVLKRNAEITCQGIVLVYPLSDIVFRHLFRAALAVIVFKDLRRTVGIYRVIPEGGF